MRRFLILFAVIVLACQAITPQANRPVPSASLRASPVPTRTPSLTPLPQTSSTSTPEPEPTTEPVEDFTTRYHPDGGLYVSDLVSLEVISPPGRRQQDKEVQARLITPVTQDLSSAEFHPFGIGGRQQATMQWVWDTSDLEPGDYTLEFSVLPEGPEWTETILLRPESELPPPQPGATWQSAEIECCSLHYITGTAADRDLPNLLIETEEQAQSAARKMRTELDRSVSINLLPRILGHGGFAGQEIYVSYLDRDYAGVNYARVVHHELIHILDNRLGGDFRPSILVEGLAVYLSGGHYKAEPIFARAATLLDLGWYIPLAPLSDDFYTSQHEIGYIEAGALVDYMVRTYGWQAFSDFYRNIEPPADGEQSQAIDKALQEHFGITYAQLEDRFKIALRRQPINPDLREDVRMTVAFYNTVRRYQQLMDPSAYFLTAWLPSGEQMRERGIVADYLRHPTTAENIALENLLLQADEELRAGRYVEARELITAVNMALDRLGDPLVEPLVSRSAH